jgi:hypothetical protein
MVNDRQQWGTREPVSLFWDGEEITLDPQHFPLVKFLWNCDNKEAPWQDARKQITFEPIDQKSPERNIQPVREAASRINNRMKRKDCPLRCWVRKGKVLLNVEKADGTEVSADEYIRWQSTAQ